MTQEEINAAYAASLDAKWEDLVDMHDAIRKAQDTASKLGRHDLWNRLDEIGDDIIAEIQDVEADQLAAARGIDADADDLSVDGVLAVLP
jgi:hypothetical protein